MIDDTPTGAREKLAKVSGIVLSHPGLKLAVEGHTDSVAAVAITPNEQHAISASADHTLKIWDLRTFTLKRTLEGRHHSLQFTWKPKGSPQMHFNGGTSDDAVLRNQHSYVGAPVNNHDVLVEVLDRRNDCVSDRARLENGANAIIDLWELAGHC